MEIRASLLAAVAVAYALGLPAGAGRAQMAKDAPARGDGDNSAAGQAGARSKPGIEIGKPETGVERPPSIRPVPGDGAGKDSIWGAPIDTSVATHQGRRANQDPKIMSINGRALLGHLLNKSKSGLTLGVAGHQDIPKPRQKGTGGGQGEPARNAIGAHIEHRATAHRDAASPAGKSAAQGFVPQGPSAPLPDAQRPASAPMPGTAAAAVQNHGTAPINSPATPSHGPVILSAGGPAINGTAMIRPSTSTGAIGGSMKTVAGVISGANVRMRHP